VRLIEARHGTVFARIHDAGGFVVDQRGERVGHEPSPHTFVRLHTVQLQAAFPGESDFRKFSGLAATVQRRQLGIAR
jgi:hypothetical protein